MNAISIKQVETQEELDARIEQQGYVAYWAKITPPCPYDKGTNGWTQWQKGIERAAVYEAKQLEAQEWRNKEIENLRKERLAQEAEARAKRTEKQKRNKVNREARAEANRKLTASRTSGKGK